MILDILLVCFWLALAVYSAWFLFGAKTHQPLTLDDLAIQWKLHKQKTGCNAKRLQSMIKINDEIVGFKCDCGYQYSQKRLITQRVKKQKMEDKHCS